MFNVSEWLLFVLCICVFLMCVLLWVQQHMMWSRIDMLRIALNVLAEKVNEKKDNGHSGGASHAWMGIDKIRLAMLEKRIMARLDELEGILKKAADTGEKAHAELTSAVAALKDEVGKLQNPELSAAVGVQLGRITAVADALDAIVPDAPPPAPEPAPAPPPA